VVRIYPLLGNGAINTTMEEAVFSMGPPRDYINSTEQNENAASPQHSRKKGSAEDLL
jgi:hypothetical protein